MPIPVECDDCGEAFRVPDREAGGVVACRSCGADVSVPMKRGQSPRSGSRRVKPARGGKRPASKAWVPWVIVGGVIVIGIGVALSMALDHFRKEAPQPDPVQVDPFGQPLPGHNLAQNPGVPHHQFNLNPDQVHPVVPENNPQQPEQPAEQPRLWNLQPDPQPVEVNEENFANMTVPGDSWAEVTFPGRPGHFAAWGKTGGETALQLLNMQTGKVTGQIQSKSSLRDFRLDPLGKYLIRLDSSGTESALEVWSFASGQRAHALPLGEKLSGLDLLEFAGPELAVLVYRPGQGNPERRHIARLINLQGGNLERDIMFAKDEVDSKNGIAISPGGEHLLLITDRLRVYQLSDGTKIGDLPLTADDRFNQPRPEYVSFSPDGEEIVGLFQQRGDTRLICWDVRTGDVLHDHARKEWLNQSFENWNRSDGQKIHWLKDKAWWLIAGKHVVDRQTGKTVWEFKFPDDFSDKHRAMFGTNYLVHTRRVNQGRVLAASPVPYDLIQSSQPMNAEPTAAPEIVLGEPVPSKLENQRTVSLPDQIVGWNVPLDPVVDQSISLVKDPFAISRSDYVKVKFSSPQAAKAVVLHAPFDPQQTYRTAREGESTWLERYDLKAGGSLGRVDLPTGADLLDASPSGERVLICNGKEQKRIDVWSMADGQHVVGFLPYAHEQEQVKTHFSSLTRSVQSVHWAGFLDDRHLLTINEGGKLILWKIPECEAVYELVTQPSSPVFFSPNRRYVGVFQLDRVRFLDARTGEVQGDLTMPFDSVTSPIVENLIAYSPDGNRLAMVARGPDVSVLLHWNLATGQFQSEFPLAGSGLTLEWVSRNHLLFNNFASSAYLVDVERNAIVWRYYLWNAAMLGKSPDDRQWMLINTNDRQVRNLAPVRFSDTDALKKIDEEFPKNLPPVVGPGSVVSLDTSGLSFTGNNPNLAAEVRQRMTEILNRNQIRVADNQPIKLVASSQLGGTESLQYEIVQSRGPFLTQGQSTGQIVSVNVQQINFRLAFLNATGQTVWERVANYRVGGLGSWVNIPQGQDPSTFINSQSEQQKNNSVGSFFKSISVPRVIYPQPRDEKGELGLGLRTIDMRQLVRLEQPVAGTLSGKSQAQFIASSREYLFQQYVDVLKLDEATWNDSVKWSPALNRPVVNGLRIAVAAEIPAVPGQTSAPQPMPADNDSAAAWEKLYGPLGKFLVEGLRSDLSAGTFGERPNFRDTRVRELLLLGGGTFKQVNTSARGLAVDLVLVMKFQSERSREKNSEKLSLHIVDPVTEQRIWSSKTITPQDVQKSQNIGQDLLNLLSQEALKELRQRAKLEAVPELGDSKVRDRLSTWEQTPPANPAAAVLEIRYYQHRGWLAQEQARSQYGHFMETRAGVDFAAATAAERVPILQACLPKWVAGETEK